MAEDISVARLANLGRAGIVNHSVPQSLLKNFFIFFHDINNRRLYAEARDREAVWIRNPDSWRLRFRRISDISCLPYPVRSSRQNEQTRANGQERNQFIK